MKTLRTPIGTHARVTPLARPLALQSSGSLMFAMHLIHLRYGTGTGVGLLEENDDGDDGVNARIERYLETAEYTIETTTLGGGEIGIR